jgi:5-methylthioadenosine/S-adenosylhomocysteine deaminase
MNERFDVFDGDVSVRDGRIVAADASIVEPHDTVVDAQGGYILPGLIQTHLHLCQTLFRGFADDLPLMDWLKLRVWPMEAAHTAATLRAAVQLAATELLCTGTTTALTMETVHNTDVVFEELAALGLRAAVGKCMMDAAPDAPQGLQETMRASLDESLAIAKRWNGAANGRLRAVLAPRFAPACSRELLEAVATLSSEHGFLIHTHAAESRDELALVRDVSGGLGNIDYLASMSLASPRLCTAHCVWVDDREQAILAEHDVKVLHCPSSNLKLGSGVAPIPEMRARGITVSLGADGAACNNRLDMFEEMRLAALLQAQRRQPGVLVARDVLWMATRGGARTVGLDRELGCIEPGRAADLIVVDRRQLHLAPDADPYSTLVYAARGADVRTTIVDGQVLVDDFVPIRIDRAAVAANARRAARQLAGRAGLSAWTPDV